jgi:DNA-binding transcriptional LysR family regulator
LRAVMDDIGRIERRFKLQDLRILISVVEMGSMHKAAERLAMSQPTVSRAIADLEQAMGVRLLDRTPQGIEATQYGRALIKRGVVMFDELRQGVRDIELLSDPSTGELRIGCSELMASGPVSAVIDELTRKHPRLVFHVLAGETATLYHALTERRVELVISRVADGLAEGHVDVGSLFDDAVVVAAGAQNPWTRRRRIQLAELVNEPWTLPPFDNELGAIVLEAFRAYRLAPPQTAVIAGSTYMRCKLAAAGRFLTAMPEFALKLPGEFASLQALPVELPNSRRTIRFVGVKNRSLSPLAELFIDNMRALAKPLAKKR